MMPDPHADGPRGLFCPNCGAELHRRLIAQSYPSPGGQYRRRCCPECHADVETIEHVVGICANVLDISGLDRASVMAVRALVRRLRQ